MASLITSTVYFVLSPVSTAHSELLARTSPTIYDVLIALFGGLAGIVAICSKQKGNVIPGVAIATALIPPLCTAGYGLATAQFNFFFGAFYLFTINTIFIAIASVWIAQLLNFPIRTIVDEGQKKRINSTITFVISIVLIPSIFFGYKLVQQEKFLQNANYYVSNVSHFEGNFLLKHDIDAKANRITLIYGGSLLSELQKKELKKKSNDFKLDHATILIKQGIALSNMDESNLELVKLKEQIINLNASLNKKNTEIDSIMNQQKLGLTLLNEIKPIFSQINGCINSESLNFLDDLDSPQVTPIVILSAKSDTQAADKMKISNWLKQRLKNDNVKIYYE